VSLLRIGNTAFREEKYDIAYQAYEAALIIMPELARTINFNIELMCKRGYVTKSGYSEKEEKIDQIALPQIKKKLPITVLIITWDVGHNCLGRSYMLAEVVQRVARHALLVGFQFPKYGDSIWEPVRKGRVPVVTLPGSNLPEFFESLQNIASRIRPDVVVACKPRLPSVVLGMMIREKWGCPLIVDVDDHELSFFKNQSELSLDQLASKPAGAASNSFEPYAELWTRLTQSLCKSADEIIVSNAALQKEFGGMIVPHVRDERAFDPKKYNKLATRHRYGVPVDAKVVLFFGTPRLHKGIDTLANAVNQVADPSFRLVVVGTAPDRSVYSRLDKLAPGRIIYLANQPFAAIPEVIAMADVVCLPQDEGHAISKFQLPAKAIDAVAMGIPLLVSNTPPLKQLVDDGVAELINTEAIPAALIRIAGNQEQVLRWQRNVRGRFLRRYSYAAASVQMHELFQRCLSCKATKNVPSVTELIQVSHHALGEPLPSPMKTRRLGIDVVVFWKQNDTGLYGRRHDMVIKYLASRLDVRKIVVFDAPMSEYDLIQRQQSNDEASQHRWVYVSTYEKMLGSQDSEKVSYNVFVYPPDQCRARETETNKPHLSEIYFPYLNNVLSREGVIAKKSVFWIYPKNYLAPAIVQYFEPAKVVVDVVDDHRAWPGISEEERQRLTENYKNMLTMADMAFVNCEPMLDAMREFFPGARLVPNGCDTHPQKSKPIHDDELDAFKSWKGKTIGFVGNLEKKIDIVLLEKIAEKFSDCRLVLVGSTHANPQVLRLRRYPNVHFAGVVPYRDVGAWLSRFDVGIIPHLDMDMTKSMNPLKLYVYLSWRVPVVSTQIYNIDASSQFLRVAHTHNEFLEHVSSTLEEEGIDEAALQRYIDENSWEERFRSHVDELLAPLKENAHGN